MTTYEGGRRSDRNARADIPDFSAWYPPAGYKYGETAPVSLGLRVEHRLIETAGDILRDRSIDCRLNENELRKSTSEEDRNFGYDLELFGTKIDFTMKPAENKNYSETIGSLKIDDRLTVFYAKRTTNDHLAKIGKKFTEPALVVSFDQKAPPGARQTDADGDAIVDTFKRNFDDIVFRGLDLFNNKTHPEKDNLMIVIGKDRTWLPTDRGATNLRALGEEKYLIKPYNTNYIFGLNPTADVFKAAITGKNRIAIYLVEPRADDPTAAVLKSIGFDTSEEKAGLVRTLDKNPDLTVREAVEPLVTAERIF
jgi:hypothetical protein